jgi:hypothetical protein
MLPAVPGMGIRLSGSIPAAAHISRASTSSASGDRDIGKSSRQKISSVSQPKVLSGLAPSETVYERIHGQTIVVLSKAATIAKNLAFGAGGKILFLSV